MEKFNEDLNNFLVNTFNTILKLEESIIHHDNNTPLTISELHLIAAIEDESGSTISQIASRLNITLASVTVAVNKLIKKGFLVKNKNINDGRSVFINLTESGKKMNEYHNMFHANMISSISEKLTEDEKAILLILVRKLESYFKEYNYL